MKKDIIQSSLDYKGTDFDCNYNGTLLTKMFVEDYAVWGNKTKKLYTLLYGNSFSEAFEIMDKNIEFIKEEVKDGGYLLFEDNLPSVGLASAATTLMNSPVAANIATTAPGWSGPLFAALKGLGSKIASLTLGQGGITGIASSLAAGNFAGVIATPLVASLIAYKGVPIAYRFLRKLFGRKVEVNRAEIINQMNSNGTSSAIGDDDDNDDDRGN